MTEQDESFESLLHYLRDTRGFDFTGYKRASLMRRVARRLQEVAVESYEAYLDYLQVHPDEFGALFNTILINVTDFFRDQESWQYLCDDVLPHLLERKSGETIRAWSAGCASGQEAYSLAIALAGAVGIDDFRQRVKIYATDVDEEALTDAGHALYDEREIAALSQDQLSTYFEPQGDRYAFRNDLRRSVIFGRNDLVQDAPISRIDILLCRNTLMYFNAETQSRILQRLHFALNPGGVLFLGKAEMLLSHAELFEPIDSKRRFFRKVAAAGGEPTNPLGYQPGLRRVDSGSPLALARYREAFNTSAVAQIIIDSTNALAGCNQRAEVLFGLSERELGRPFQDLDISFRPAELRAAVAKAQTEHRPVWIREVEFRQQMTEPMLLDIEVTPLIDNEGVVLGSGIAFNDVSRYHQLQGDLDQANRQLEHAYEELQSTNEELETTNEELQSTVEELETTNEELQSTNEELETMNEELQSMNDELSTSNDALRARTQEVGSLNSFMSSILASLRAGVIVVNSEMRVQVWNRHSEDLWGLRSDEAIGEHLLGLDIGLPLHQLRPLIRDLIMADGGADNDELEVDAVNRRGRRVRVRVTGSPLNLDGEPSSGAILIVSEIDQRHD